jgi:hypothetical protein
MGDGAHPYGPSGQGIDIATGFTDAGKRTFQQSCVEDARALGEAAEKRNAQALPTTEWGLFLKGRFMKAMEIATGGILNLKVLCGMPHDYNFQPYR